MTIARVAIFDELGGPEVLRIVDRDIPDPGPGEVQVRVAHAGLNRAELLFMQGVYFSQPNLPGSAIGVEAAGTIELVGRGVQGVTAGDRVVILPMLDMASHGVIAELVNVPVTVLEKVPSEIELEQASAFWMAHATAYGMLVQAGGLVENARQTVVITGASSSVGVASFQIAKAYGAQVIATTRTRSKVDALKQLGAHEVIVTEEEDLKKRIHEITDGRGFDLACDAVVGPMVEPLAEAAAEEATMVLMGNQSGVVPTLPFYPLLAKGIRFTGFHLVWHLLDHPARRSTAIDHLSEELRSGTYHPVIDQTFEFGRIKEAYGRMASNKQVGKIVINVER